MNPFQLDTPSLLKQRLDNLRDSRAKVRATTLHNHTILLAKLKELRNEASVLQREKVQQKTDVLNQLQEKYKLEQNKIEEVKLQTIKFIKDTAKCKSDIDSAERTRIETEESIRKARARFCCLRDAKHETDEELRNRNAAFLLSYGYFRHRLECYLEIDDLQKTSGIFHFSKVKADEYYLRLTLKDGHWSFSELTPELPQHEQLTLKLAATNDIQGFLACVRDLFQEHRHLKQKSH